MAQTDFKYLDIKDPVSSTATNISNQSAIPAGYTLKQSYS
jgi:hypothetical protein